jgi:NADH dehydrogenase
MAKHVVIIGGGFAGLSAAKGLGNQSDIKVTLVDRRNHHLFQPLLYQVATAGLSPADIAAPIRSILSRYKNIQVIQAEVTSVDLDNNCVKTKLANSEYNSIPYDYLILACGAQHSYFGNEHWESNAPGLKTIEHATEIRRRILTAYESAEATSDQELRRKLLTFVIVGGGPTGVEMAGAIGEMSRYTLARDFRSIDAKSTRVFLMEGGPRILAPFPKELSDRATSDLEKLGVQVWVNSRVNQVDKDGVTVGAERINAATVIWAAGIKASHLGETLSVESDRAGRICVNEDLSLAEHANVFVAGDQAHTKDANGEPLPSLAPVATQQGKFIAKNIRQEIAGRDRIPFHYVDKGIMATVGRNKAIALAGKWKLTGRLAWLAWLLIHIYFLTGFKNRLFVVLSWAWSYLTYRRGARLIVGKRNNFGESVSVTKTDNPQETTG